MPPLHPSTPLDYRIPIPKGVDYVVLSLTSPDSLCMTLSSQDGNCTTYGAANVQTMTADTRAGMTLSRERHPSGVAALRIALNANDSACHDVQMFEGSRYVMT
jgi:hypothetical protein